MTAYMEDMKSEMSRKDRETVKRVIIGVIIVVSIIAFLILNPLVVISPGKRGVVVQLGAVKENILEEGIHFVMPITQSVKKMNVQIQKIDVSAEASSKDLQTVNTTITLNFRLDPKAVNKIYQTLGYDYDDRVIKPAIQEYMKKSTAMFTAEELVTKRELVKDDFKKSLSTALAGNHILVDNVFMTNFSFSKGFNHAIEQKVTAEQNALTEKNNLQKVKFMAEQRIAQAEGEAKAIAIQVKAITQQGGKDYVQLKAIEKWSGNLPVQMIPGGAVPFINLEYQNKK